MFKKIYLFLILLIFIFSLPSFSKTQDITTLFLNKYKSINSLKTTYEQTLKNKSTKETEKRYGIIYIKKIKGKIKIRWETLSPEKEILIITKTNIWDYFPEEKLAYNYKLKDIEQSKTILDLITGKINLKNRFNIEKDDSDINKYKLIPKNPEPNMVMVYLWLTDNNLIKKINIIDFFGNENIIVFKKIKTNINLDNNLFWQKPPKDVQILQGRPGIK